VLSDRLLGVMALLFSAFLAWHGVGLQAAFSYEPVGPRAFPLLLSALIGLCGLVLTWKGGNKVEPNLPGVNGRILMMVGVLAVLCCEFCLARFHVVHSDHDSHDWAPLWRLLDEKHSRWRCHGRTVLCVV